MRVRLVLAMLAVMSVMFVPTARAQSPLEVAENAVAEATERLETYLAELDVVQQRGNDLAGRFWQVQSQLELLDIEMRQSRVASVELDGQRSGLVAEVRVIAVDRYVSRGNPIQWTDVETPADRAAAEALADLIVGSDLAVIDQLAALEAQQELLRERLDNQKAEHEQRLAEVQSTQLEVGRELERLADLRTALDGELTVLEDALADLELAERQRAEESARTQAEEARAAEEKRRAQAVAEAAAARTRQAQTAAAQAAVVVATPTAVPNPQPSEPLATAVPNPQPSEPLATAVPNPQPSEPLATAVPNPQPSEPLATAVPNPQPSEPLATAVPNPQPSEPLATAVPNPQPSQPLATAVPNPQPSQPLPTQPGPAGILCPLNGPFTHVDDFNSPRAVGGIHRANDLISASGTPVIAVASGMVEHRNSSVGGLSAHLRGDNGDYYFYTHLSGYENVGAGHVNAGTVIGYVGMTGNAPIPHLHFEIHRNGYGNYVNPYPAVKQACGT